MHKKTFLLGVLLLPACGNPDSQQEADPAVARVHPSENPLPAAAQTAPVKDSTLHASITAQHAPTSTGTSGKAVPTTAQLPSEEDGPPFKYPCACNLDELGSSAPKEGEYNEFISGAGLRFDLPACNWMWNEYVANEIPPDSSNEVFRVYLINQKKGPPQQPVADYTAAAMRKYVMAIYTRNSKTGTDTCIYDPYKPRR